VENIKRLNKRKADIGESGPRNPPKQLDILESPRLNKNLRSLHKKKSSKDTINRSELYQTLDLGLISKDLALRPYWNESCKDLQPRLSLPHKIALRELGSSSLNGSSNFTEEKLSHLNTLIKLTDSTQKPLLVSLRASSIAITENDVKNVKAARKIRVFPQNETTWKDLTIISRRAYNLAVDRINNKLHDKSESRRSIRSQIESECFKSNTTYCSTVVDEAVLWAYQDFKYHMQRIRKGEKSKFRFRSRRNPRQSFIVQRISSNGQPLPKVLGRTIITEKIENVGGQTARIIHENGRWFIILKISVEAKPFEIQEGYKIASLDPGIRTFQTTCDGSDYHKIGDGFFSRIELLFEREDKLKSALALNSNKTESTFTKEHRVSLIKKLNKVRNKLQDLIDDLHKRTAKFLVDNYDIILIPTFRVSEMIKSSGRKLSKKTARNLGRLSHFKFKTFLKWMATKHGKIVLEVNESFTSKTVSWTGEIISNLGGRKSINDGSIVVDRDVNGARGILLRALTTGRSGL